MLTVALLFAPVARATMQPTLPPTASRTAPISQEARGLVGTWELTDFTRRATDGRVTRPWGSHPAGQITYDGEGQMMALLMHESRNEASGRPAMREVEAEFSAYFGSYTVDPIQRVITHHVRGSLNAERASGELRRHYELNDGTLILTFTRPQDGATNRLVWKQLSRHAP
jgi:hypothetical protein